MPQIEDVLSIAGFSLLDSSSEPNAAFMVARLKPFADRAGRRQFGAGADRARVRRRAVGPLGDDLPVQPAADHRPLDQRRLRIPARGARGAGPRADGQRHARADRGCEPGPEAQPRVLHLHRVEPVALARHRPREGAGARAQHERRVHRAAGDARRHLRQQLQPVRPHLAGATSRARRRTGATSTASGRSMCATRTARWCRCARSPICASSSGRR